MTTDQLWSSLLSRSFEPRDWYVREEVGEGRKNLVEPGGFKMWVYVEVNKGVWAVGFFRPNGDWVAESDYPTPAAAASRVRWLNGGS